MILETTFAVPSTFRARLYRASTVAPSKHHRYDDSCNTCGNPIPGGLHQCPYFDSFDIEIDQKSLRERRADIGHSNQSVLQALAQLDREIIISRKRGDDVLVIIHGHGSTGEGGQIKVRVRQHLAKLNSSNRYTAYLPGEHLHDGYPQIRKLGSSHVDLRRLTDWERGNHGIVLIFL